MAACFATLQQFSEERNCFIDGTPMNFDEPLTPYEKMGVVRWDAVAHDFGDHDTGSESLDTEMLRKRHPSNRKFAKHSGWTGYSPDECYSPASGQGILATRYSDERWQKLPNYIPSPQEKVAQWMSFEDAPYRTEYKPSPISSPVFVQVQDQRPVGRRSRSIILRFEEQQRRKAWAQKSPIYQASSQVSPGLRHSKTTQQRSMNTTPRTPKTPNSPWIEKPLPELPKNGPSNDFLAADDEMLIIELYSESGTPPLAVTGESVLPEQQAPIQPRKIRSEMALRRPQNKSNTVTPERMSKSPSTKSPTRNVIRSQSPKPLQLVTKLGLENAEQKQRHTMPTTRTGRDEALRKLENGDENDKPVRHQRRTRSETISKEVIRETLGLASKEEPIPRASVEQIETVLSKPSPVGRKERPRPAPIDMGAVLEANNTYLHNQIEIYTETKRDSGVDCHTPEALHIEHPSALIPRPLSLPFKNVIPEESVQIMSPVERLESDHDRYMRHQKFFDNRPLNRCLDGDGVDEISDELFDRILEETELYDKRESVVQRYQKRAFWDNVRLELDVEDEIEEVFEGEKVESPRSAGIRMRRGQSVINVYPPEEW